MKEKIVLGLSGGVDSAVAARLLQERYEVTGLYLDIGLGGTGAADAAAVAERLSLGEHLLLGNGEDQSGGRRRPSILCDVMEAVVAASYLDGGFAVASDIVTRLILPQLAEAEKTHDYKTELQELVQRKKSQQLSYELISETGPDHCKEFNVHVLLNGREVGTGSGTSKKRAEQAAAAQAIVRLFPEQK